MSLSKTLLLGFIAGVTILIGLPIGRVRRPMPGVRAFLNATACGVLLFLVWDVLTNAWAPIDAALTSVHAHHGGLGRALGYGLLFAGGLAAGLLGLVAYERWMSRTARRSGPPPGPGAMSVAEVLGPTAALDPARRLALMIAIGIGLHNFAEGLAIGQSAATNRVALATLLVIGFGLHNATEGFGIVAPLTCGRAGVAPPTWRFLAMLGLIGGGPTFVGTIIGHSFTNAAVSVVFLTLAAGSIIYVILQLVAVGQRLGRPTLLAYGLLAGMLAGFFTDAIVSAAGA